MSKERKAGRGMTSSAPLSRGDVSCNPIPIGSVTRAVAATAPPAACNPVTDVEFGPLVQISYTMTPDTRHMVSRGEVPKRYGQTSLGGQVGETPNGFALSGGLP